MFDIEKFSPEHITLNGFILEIHDVLEAYNKARVADKPYFRVDLHLSITDANTARKNIRSFHGNTSKLVPLRLSLTRVTIPAA
jgi:hypothetical protein